MLSSQIERALNGLSMSKESDIYKVDDSPRVNINALTGKAGVYYEKLRYMIDYKEEHSIRRSAIERIIKRKCTIEQDTNVGLTLLEELVGGGYLPNDQVAESAASIVQVIIDKYLTLADVADLKQGTAVSLAASEIERLVSPQTTDDLIVEAFVDTIAPRIRHTGSTDKEKQVQTYIACRKRFLREDSDALLYSVLLKFMPELHELSGESNIRESVTKFNNALRESREALDSSLNQKIISKIRDHTVYFSVIREIVRKYGTMAGDIFKDSERLSEEVSNIMSQKYEEQYKKTSKSGTRAIIYILLTKVILAFLIELPYEYFVLSSIQYVALLTNVIFHPLLLFVMVRAVKPPSEENTNAVIAGVSKMTSAEANIDIINIKPESSVMAKSAFALLYTILFSISFGIILSVLQALHFNIVSTVLFVFFLTLVSYFGLRVRYSAKRWYVTSTSEEGFLALLWNFFTTPIVRTGRWLSEQFAAVNIFVFIMDFIIETPFKLLLSTFNAFLLFLKEQREDFY